MSSLEAQAVPTSPASRGVVSAPLTQEQVRSFHEQGFLSVPSISSPGEIARLIELYDEMFKARVGYDDGYFVDFAGDEARGDIQIPQILGPVAYRPQLRETRIWRECAAMARQLLGPEAVFRFDHALTKPAEGGAPTPWHQDQAFYERGTWYHTISFWVPLQDVDAASGCLKYIAGSHKGPLLPHRPIQGNRGVHGLETLEVDPGAPVSHCPLKAGGCVVHHRLTLHGADSNVSKTPRRAYVIAFGVRQKSVVVPQEYPWNAVKRTASEARRRSSLKRHAKLLLKRELMRWGLLDR